MFENEILKPGDKIKKLRKKYNITQDEVVDDEMTRNNLSNIENLKQKLSSRSAKIISSSFNRIFLNKEIDIKITAAWLMESVDIQANRIFSSELNKLNKQEKTNFFYKKYNKLTSLIDEYYIDKLLQIQFFLSAADYLYEVGEYSKSLHNCKRGIKISIYIKNEYAEIKFTIKKSKVYIATGKNDVALKELEYAEYLNNEIKDNEFSIQIYFNKAIAYYNDKDLDRAFECLKVLYKSNIEDNNILLWMHTLHAEILMDKGNLTMAEKEYKKIVKVLKEKKDNKNMALIYVNIAYLKYKNADFKVAAEYVNKSIKSDINNIYLKETYYYAGLIFENISTDIAEDYFLKAVCLNENDNRDDINKNVLGKILYRLLKLYINKDDEINIKKICDKFLLNDLNYDAFYFEIIRYYIKKDMYMDEIVKICDEQLSKIKKDEKI